MSFRKYDHVEKLGHTEVDGILVGEVLVFAKLDGTNASVWFHDGKIRAGSRTRTLSEGADNAGFLAWVLTNPDMFMKVFDQFPNWTVYGEWLVPHTLNTYRKDAWRRFYAFDVYDREANKYLSYEEYAPVLQAAGFDVIEPMCKYTNPSEEQIRKESENNTYLIMENAGVGEGIVAKNYTWQNQFGRQPWAKVVRNEFKEENRRAFGTTEKGGEFQVEAAIAEKYVTATLVAKTRAKIEQEIINPIAAPLLASEELRRSILEKNRGKLIPQLLGMVFYELIREESWAFLKEHKFPTVDYKNLRQHCIYWTKKHAADLF